MQDEPESQVVADDLTPKHTGAGWYQVGTHKVRGEAKAIEFAAALRAALAVSREPDLSDKDPEGYDFSIREDTFKFGNSFLELPMNWPYLPMRRGKLDGARVPSKPVLNKYYDREWQWGWANMMAPQDLTSKGYVPVSMEELEKLVEQDKVPSHYLYACRVITRDHMRMLVHGDLILMRIPRRLWRQQRAAKDEEAFAAVRRKDREVQEFYAEHGVHVSTKLDPRVLNELKIQTS